MPGFLFGSKEAIEGAEPEAEGAPPAEVGAPGADPAAAAGPAKAGAAANGEAAPEGGEKRSLFEKPKHPDPRNFMNHPRFLELREQRDTERAARTQAETERAAALAYRQAVETHYGSQDGALEALAADVALLDAIEELQRTDPEVMRAAAKIRRHIESKGGAKVNGSEKATPAVPAKVEPAAAPARDPLLVRAVERDARASIFDALKPHGILEPFQRTIANDLIRKLPPDDLAALTPEAIEEHTQAWISEHAFSEEQLTGRKVRRAAGRTVPASGGAGAAAGGEDDAPAPSDRPKGEPEPPKNFAEWQKRHSSRFAGVQRSIGRS